MVHQVLTFLIARYIPLYIESSSGKLDLFLVTLLQIKYARIISLLAKKMQLSEEMAMELFYNSNTYILMSKGISDFHCLSDAYLVEEIFLEQKK